MYAGLCPRKTLTVPVCYCFGFTPVMVREVLLETGKSPIVERIASEMNGEFCACEFRKPQGSGCLGNVKAAVKAAQARIASHETEYRP
jgi:hypothetical protein